LNKLNTYVKNGGHILYTFKSGFSNENVKVRATIQPGIINEACGISYSQFTIPENVTLRDDPFQVGADKNKVHTWMELITPGTAKVLAWYNHPVWKNYAAITQNNYGKGTATYVGCMTSEGITEKIIRNVLEKANLWGKDQQIIFPVVVKSGVNQDGKTIHYFFNYSSGISKQTYPYKKGTELLNNHSVEQNALLALEPWGIKIIEEN
jgi:beta-galactosidase